MDSVTMFAHGCAVCETGVDCKGAGGRGGGLLRGQYPGLLEAFDVLLGDAVAT